jgi:hypothetical protein
MDEREAQKLSERGLVGKTPAGRPAVRVSLQYQHRFEEPSRDARRRLLSDAFEPIARWLESNDAHVDLDSLSVSGQTVEALLPIDDYDELTSKLQHHDVRVDQLVDRQVV